MSNLPYHLRPNKAADRLAMVEAIRNLPKLKNGYLDEYTYFGLGGPFLEDMRLMYEFFPEIKLFSFENQPWIHDRQKFHLPCGNQHLIINNLSISDFISEYKSEGKKGIFWLDYTGLEYGNFADFMTLLGKAALGSMIKVTLRATPSDYHEDYEEIQDEIVKIFQKRFEDIIPINLKDDFWKSQDFTTMVQNLIQEALIKRENESYREFHSEFVTVLPSSFDQIPKSHREFAELIQVMLKIASQKVFTPDSRFSFYPISSFYYTDTNSSWMYTLTGIVWLRNDFETVKRAYQKWNFANLTWSEPQLIDIPDLSSKERLLLQSHLPDDAIHGKILRQKLGYLIDKDPKNTERMLKRYADFHRYSPYLLRGIP